MVYGTQSKTLLFLTTALALVLGLVAASALAYSEAPDLSEAVEAGELEPVEDRLPDEPLVVGPGVLMSEHHVDWEVGQYGGVLRSAHSSPNWHPDYFMALTESLVAGPGFDTTLLRGNVVQDFSVSEDNTVFTFELRRGLRWSDGEPVTTEDVRFTYEDVLLNEELTPAFPTHLRAGGRSDGEPMELNIVDDYTFEIIFDEPYGEFLTALAVSGWVSYQELLKPSHYLKQFHIDYTSLEEMEPYLAEAELDDEWWELFFRTDVAHWDITNVEAAGFPVLSAWMPVEPPATGVLRFERNPYYFKVDEEGQQLPYLDALETHEVTEAEIAQMRIISGEIDYMSAGVSLERMSVYVEHAEEAGYVVQLHPGLTDRTLFLNMTYDDEAWQSLVQDPEFRQAINMGIDREEIIDIVYFEMATLTDTVPVDYDADAANAKLDAMGLDERDADGYRLGPDGERIEVFLEIMDQPDIVPLTEILVEHLGALGLDASMQIRSDALISQRRDANETLATVQWRHNRGGWEHGLFRDYLPDPLWAPEWEIWYTSGGEEGQEPPAWIKELYSIHADIMRTSPGDPEGIEAVDRLTDWYWEHIPYMPLQSALEPVVYSEDLGNVPNEEAIDTEVNLRGVVQFFYR